MIEFTQGNLFDGEHQAIVNPVNCVGRSGKGLALLFKKRFPAMFLAYKKYCDEGKLRPGTVPRNLGESGFDETNPHPAIIRRML